MFRYWGRELEYFDSPYNDTAQNERAVEVAIAIAWLEDRVLADGVEVGAVMPHYGLGQHRCIDLYEQGDGIDNVDVFDLAGDFDWILSISTLEHIVDAPAALDHLVSLLAPGGQMLVTVGAGQHGELDAYLASGAGASRCCTLVRSGDTWCQTTELQMLAYGTSTRWAEACWVGEFENLEGVDDG